jgi:BatD DUF11 like domain
MKLTACLLLFGVLSTSASAQSAGVELRVGAQTIEVGEVVSAQLVCTNTGDPKLPAITTPAGISLELLNSNPSVSSRTSFINGRRSSSKTYTYPLRLTGVKAGTFLLGPYVIEAGGSSYQTKPIRISVRGASATNQPLGDQLVFVKLEVSKTSLYVTESFRATLTIGLRKVYVDGQLLNYDQLLRSVDANASTLGGFGPQFTPSEIRLTDASGNPHEYLLYRHQRDIRGDEVGTLTVGPIFLKVDYPTSFRRSFWGRGLEPSRTKRVTARADAYSIEVKGPPVTGRPTDFTGAIGRYTIAASAKPNRVTQGQPVTLALTIRGVPIDGVAGPNLSKQPELMSRFEFSTGELRGDVERASTKVFRRAVFPKQQGEQTIPPIRWSYFDPRSERYVSLHTKAIPITVDPPAGGEVPDFSLADAGDDASNGRLTVLQGGISPNVVSVDLVLDDQAVAFVPAQIGTIVIAPPALYLLMTLLLGHRARLRGDRGYARRRGARGRVRAGISAAINANTATEQTEMLAQALTSFVSDIFNLPPGELTPGDVETILVQNSVDENLTREIVEFLRSADAIRYAPATAEMSTMSETADRVRRWVDLIEKTTA